MSRINLRLLKEEGINLRVKEEKVGVLRGGNSGISFGNVHTGSCLRQTYARSFLSYSKKPDLSTRLMFDGGERNEDSWMDDITKSWGNVIKADDYVEWATDAGIKVTGSPDVLLLNDEGKPVHGIEHKRVSSLYTARDVGFLKKPKMDALIQTAHYMWQIGCPFDLVYTCDTNFHGPDWATSTFPSPGQPGSEYINYTYYNRYQVGTYVKGTKKGEPKYKKQKVLINQEDQKLDYSTLCKVYPNINHVEFKNVKPFFIIYNVDIVNGVVFYKEENQKEWTKTIIETNRIKNYYEKAAMLVQQDKLPLRPVNIDALGEQMFWSKCDYCELKAVCDRYENDKEAWEKQVKGLVDG